MTPPRRIQQHLDGALETLKQVTASVLLAAAVIALGYIVAMWLRTMS